MDNLPTQAAPTAFQRPLVHLPDICLLLGRTRQTVSRLVREGLMPPPIDIGGRPAWEPAVIESWLRERREAANARREQRT